MQKSITLRLNDEDQRDREIMKIQKEVRKSGLIFSDYIKQAICEKHSRIREQDGSSEKLRRIDCFLSGIYGEDYLVQKS